jgi:UDP-N-acetylmuramoyl-L-alanyl-D-glutamate--2,6-diaminopimelate ligase
VPAAAGSLPERPAGVAPRPLAGLAQQLPAAAWSGPPVAGIALTGVTLDSRTVRPGDLYAALPGARAHGADFAGNAVRAGAVAVLTDPAGRSRAAAAGVPVVILERPREVLGSVAAWVYGWPAESLLLLAVTGTNGKTTTAYLIEAGLRAAGRTPGMIGTVETRVGDAVLPSVRTTPEAPDVQALLAVMRERGADAVVMEVSSHALAQGRVDGLRFDVAVFTNLSQDHLDFHGDLESYYATKARLFTAARARRGVVNVDDPYGARLAREAAIPMTTVSPAGVVDADWVGAAVAVQPTGSSVRLTRAGAAEVAVAVALAGRFNLDNAALAVVALTAAGLPADRAAGGVAGVRSVPGRMERIDAGQPFTAIVDYAHTPEAVATLLSSLRSTTAGRLLVVLGCGGDRDRLKRPQMGAAAAAGADVAVFTTDNPRSEDPAQILDAMLAGAVAAGGATPLVEPDRAAAIARAVELAGPGDTLVVAGKGHEQGQEYGGAVVPFDDRAVLRAALARAGNAA